MDTAGIRLFFEWQMRVLTARVSPSTSLTQSAMQDEAGDRFLDHPAVADGDFCELGNPVG